MGEGDTIPADFDSMIAKIIAYGRTRDEALARLRRAMAETTVVIEGGATNKSFILELLAQSEVVDGKAGWADTGWIDRVRAEGPARRPRARRRRRSSPPASRPTRTRPQIEVTRLLESAHGGRPQVQHQVGRPVDFKLRGTPYQVTVLQTGPQRFRVSVAAGGVEHVVEAEVERLDDFHARMTVGDQRYRLVTATHGPVHLVEVDGVTHRVSRDEGGVLRSPAPALVVATPVAVGDMVAAGAPVLVLESMKMETVLRAPFAARVRELLVPTGGQVETGAPLVRLEPVEEDAADAQAAAAEEAGPALDLPPVAPAASAQERAARAREDVAACCSATTSTRPTTARCMPPTWRRARSSRGRRRRRRRRDGAARRSSPTSPSSAATGPPGRTCTPSCACTARASTSTPTCRASTSSAAGCPRSSATGWPGCSPTTASPMLDRTPELEEAVFRIFLAQQRSAPDVQLATALLQQWIAEPPPAEDAGRPGARPARAPGPRPPSCASRWSATWPAASASAGSTSLWSTRSAPACWPASRDEVAGARGRPRRP